MILEKNLKIQKEYKKGFTSKNRNPFGKEVLLDVNKMATLPN